MASEGNGAGPNGEQPNRQRRSSITQAAMSNLFQRGGSNAGTGPSNDGRRRLSVTTLGLSGTQQNASPSFNLRRGSMSTNSNSDSIDESAIEEDEGQLGAKTAPTTPFVRRMSFGAPTVRGYRAGGSPGNGNDPVSTSPPLGRRHSGQKSPPPAQGSSISAALSAAGRRSSLISSSLPQASTIKHPRAPSDNAASRSDQSGFNWSEQLRSRAESSVSGARPSFSLASSPPRGSVQHDRAKSVSDMPQPPVQVPAPKPQPERRKPDAFQERILKGDFYMD
ncbi:hypothetical protein CC79DRAFT_358728 [Sarocladium strictum]